MTLRTNVTGTYDSNALDRLALPVAWSGTVGADDRAAQENDLRELIRDARQALQENADAVAVEIENGEIIATVVE